jgi:hypothetical protein
VISFERRSGLSMDDGGCEDWNSTPPKDSGGVVFLSSDQAKATYGAPDYFSLRKTIINGVKSLLKKFHEFIDLWVSDFMYCNKCTCKKKVSRPQCRNQILHFYSEEPSSLSLMYCLNSTLIASDRNFMHLFRYPVCQNTARNCHNLLSHQR